MMKVERWEQDRGKLGRRIAGLGGEEGLGRGDGGRVGGGRRTELEEVWEGWGERTEVRGAWS